MQENMRGDEKQQVSIKYSIKYDSSRWLRIKYWLSFEKN